MKATLVLDYTVL